MEVEKQPSLSMSPSHVRKDPASEFAACKEAVQMANLQIDDKHLPILIDILSDYLHQFREDAERRSETATAMTLLERWGDMVTLQVRSQVSRRF